MAKILFQSPYSADAFVDWCDDIGLECYPDKENPCIVDLDDYDPDEISEEEVNDKIEECGGSYVYESNEYDDEE